MSRNSLFSFISIAIILSYNCRENSLNSKLPQQSPKPNIIWIVIDSLRADIIGRYGVTPNLEEFTKTAVTYNFHLVNAAWTRPSTIVFFTGKYASRSPVNFWDYPTTKEEVDLFYKKEKNPLPKYLKNFGYKTYMVGNNPFLTDKYGLGVDVGFDTLSDFSNYSSDTIKITKKTLDIFDNELKNSKEPFFFFLNFNDPHKPYTPPPGFTSRIKTTEVLEEKKQNYLGEVAFVDEELGKIFTFLKQAKLWDNSLILITADHGEVMHPNHSISPFTGTNTYYGHGQDLFLENIHVPLLIKYPKQTTNFLVNDLTRSIDIYPTILEVSSNPIPTDLDGESLVSLHKSTDIQPRFYYGETRSTQCYGEGSDFLLQRSYRFHEIGKFWQGHVGQEFYIHTDIQSDPNQIFGMKIPDIERLDELKLDTNKKERILYLWKKLRSMEPKLPIYSIRYNLTRDSILKISIPHGKLRLIQMPKEITWKDTGRMIQLQFKQGGEKGLLRFEVYPDVSFPRIEILQDSKKISESEILIGNFGLSLSSCSFNCELLYESPLGDPPGILEAKVHIWKQGGIAKNYERSLDLGEEALDILKKQGYVH
ncbi:MAG: sulfatase [Leptospira sp.]|nr:sulfatase [Leptospira sp.]